MDADGCLSVDEVWTNCEQTEESLGSGGARSCSRSQLCIVAFVLAVSGMAVLGYAYVSRVRALRSRTVDLHWDVPDATAVLLLGAGGQWRQFTMVRGDFVYRCEVKPTSTDESKYFIRARVHGQLFESKVRPLGNAKRVHEAFEPSWALAPVVVHCGQSEETVPAGYQVSVQWRDSGGFGPEDTRVSPSSNATQSSSRPVCAQHQWCPLVTLPIESKRHIFEDLALHVPRHYQVQIRIKCAPLASPNAEDESTETKWEEMTLPTVCEGARIVVTTKRSAQGKLCGNILLGQRFFVLKREFVLHLGASEAGQDSAAVFIGSQRNAWRRAVHMVKQKSSNTSATTVFWGETVINAGESRFFVRGLVVEPGRFFFFESDVRSIDTRPQFQLTFDAGWELSCFIVRTPTADMNAGSMYYVQWRDSGGFGTDDRRKCHGPEQNVWHKVQDHEKAERELMVSRLHAPEYRLGFQKMPKVAERMDATTFWRPVPIQVLGAGKPVVLAEMDDAKQVLAQSLQAP